MTVDDTPQNSPHTKTWFVRLALIVTVLFVLVSVGAVGWRWYNVRFPNTAMSVRGSVECEGADVTVSDDDGNPIFHGRLTRDNQYQLIVLVESGFYTIVAQRSGEVLVRDRIFIPSTGGVQVQVAAPATLPATGASSPTR